MRREQVSKISILVETVFYSLPSFSQGIWTSITWDVLSHGYYPHWRRNLLKAGEISFIPGNLENPLFFACVTNSSLPPPSPFFKPIQSKPWSGQFSRIPTIFHGTSHGRTSPPAQPLQRDGTRARRVDDVGVWQGTTQPCQGEVVAESRGSRGFRDPGIQESRLPRALGSCYVLGCTRRMDSSCGSSDWTSLWMLEQHKNWWNWISRGILEVLYRPVLKETSLLRVLKLQSPFINPRQKSSFLSPGDPKLKSGINQTKVSRYILTFYVSMMRGLLKLCGETALSSHISTFFTFSFECWLNFPAQAWKISHVL